ncbi:hypothetical protein GN956_G15110 [Arapaima gigas]
MERACSTTVKTKIELRPGTRGGRDGPAVAAAFLRFASGTINESAREAETQPVKIKPITTRRRSLAEQLKVFPTGRICTSRELLVEALGWMVEWRFSQVVLHSSGRIGAKR